MEYKNYEDCCLYASKYVEKAARILKDFKKEARLTMHQTRIVLGLYNGEASDQELKDVFRIKNIGQFSSSVLMPLRERGYVDLFDTENKKMKIVRITKKGRDLVEKIFDNI